MTCRHCGAALDLTFLDLGSAPPSNAYLTEQALRRPEKWYPLRVLVCTECWLVQSDDFADSDELFSADYAYFSSYSSTWLEHARRYVEAIVDRLGLGEASQVIEVASNDGYLLQYVKERGIPCLGIEPTSSTAQAGRDKGIEVVEAFFGVELARKMLSEGKSADLIVANNVLAHVPDINDFVDGLAQLLKPSGVVTFEFPHLLRLVRENQFDTIYHEHFSYLSLTVVSRVCASFGLTVFDVEELHTHGGSLRVYVQRSDTGKWPVSTDVGRTASLERDAGVTTAAFYRGFQSRADRAKNDFLEFLIDARKAGKIVAAYGAAAKGNTLLNYAGVRPDLIRCVADRNPAKQGRFMPGSRIPIVDEARLRAINPDFVIILPWNLKDEVMAQLSRGGFPECRFVVAIPELSICRGDRK